MANHEPQAVQAREVIDRTFKYHPVTDSHSIRVLTLHPGTAGDRLSCTLVEETVSSDLDYEAVSYVWGKDSRRFELWCNGAALPITQSIRDALIRLRDPEKPRRLWADQICINQNDIVERSQQVQLMNIIYKNAKQVLVWLGRDHNGLAAGAVKMVHHLTKVFGDEELHREFRQAHSENLFDQDPTPWKPLSKLSQLPWFNRMWIVQEIGTNAPATLFWGDAEFDWEELSEVTEVLNKQYHYLRSRFTIYTPSLRYLYRRFVEPEEEYSQFHHRGNFIYELQRARHLRSKDPRDHVYAFLGHFSINTGSKDLAHIQPDYSRSIVDVFVDVAVRELHGASTLIILSACQSVIPIDTGRFIPEDKTPKLPSWVPDWRLLPMHILSSPETPHRAAGETKPKLRIDEAQRILHIDGLRIDAISTKTVALYRDIFQFKRGKSGKTFLKTLWNDLLGFKNFGLSQRYRNGDSAFFALVQTLTNGCVINDRTQLYQDFPPSQWLANGAAYLVRTQETKSSDEIDPSLVKLAGEGDAFKWSHEATLVSRHRKFAVTANGYYVTGPVEMGEGDIVTVLYGGRTPYVLRRIEEGWRILGDCHVHGIMNGEALESGEYAEETFSIY